MARNEDSVIISEHGHYAVDWKRWLNRDCFDERKQMGIQRIVERIVELFCRQAGTYFGMILSVLGLFVVEGDASSRYLIF